MGKALRRIVAALALVLALVMGLALLQSPGPNKTPAPASPTGTPDVAPDLSSDADPLLVDDLEDLVGGLDQIFLASDGYPDSLYWFQVSGLGVTLFDSHLLSQYTVSPDRSAYTACLSAVDTGEWVLYDSTVADITGTGTGTGTSPADQATPDCVANGVKSPTGRALAARSVEIDVASIGNLIGSYYGDAERFPARSELIEVVESLIAPGNAVGSYTVKAVNFTVCVTNPRYDVSATFDSDAKTYITIHPNKNCETRKP